MKTAALRPTPAAWAAIWVLLVCALVGLTLDNTHPYQGDEVYYIKSAIGMLSAGDFLVPQHDGVIRLQKPILAYWLTAAGYKVFGISLWAGRVPFLIAAAMLLVLVYRFARLLFPDREAAYLSVVLLSSSTLFLLFSRVSMTDMPLALFSTATLYFLCRALLVPDRRPRDVTLAYLSMGAGFLAKGGPALLPLAAVAAFVVLAKPAGGGALLRAMLLTRHVAAFALIASPWYVYLLLAYPDQLRAQLVQEAADNLWPGTMALAGHLAFYLGALVVYQVPAIGLTAWAKVKNRAADLCAPRIRPLAWYAGLSLAVSILLYAHHRDRYLLPVLPALALMMAHVIEQGGLTRVARRLAAAGAIVQIAGIWMHASIVGQPLHDLVGYWERQLHGDLAVQALGDRETTWALAISRGRLVPYRDGTPYLLAPAEQAGQRPGYEIIRRASRASDLTRAHGNLAVEERQYVLLGLRARPIPPSGRPHDNGPAATVPEAPGGR